MQTKIIPRVLKKEYKNRKGIWKNSGKICYMILNLYIQI